jgi:hypothetical protein
VHAVLLTWNPGRGNDYVWGPAAWEREVVVPCQEGQTVATTWGVGNHVHGIGPGDDAFLYRQGPHGRGIVARGVIRSAPWSAPHWDAFRWRRGATTKVVDVELQEAVPLDLAIGVDELEALMPEFAWRKVYSSGRRTPPSVTERLKQLWDMHLAEDGP